MDPLDQLDLGQTDHESQYRPDYVKNLSPEFEQHEKCKECERKRSREMRSGLLRLTCKKNQVERCKNQETEGENNAKENKKKEVTNGTIIPAHKDYKNYIEQREFNMLAKNLLSDFEDLTTIPNNDLKEHLDTLDRLFKEVRIYSLLHPEILSELQEKLNVFAGKITLNLKFPW